MGVELGSVSRRKVVVTDTSKTGWGALCYSRPAFDSWVEPMPSWHIKCLEIISVLLASEFRQEFRGHHVLVRSDNMTVVAYINH